MLLEYHQIVPFSIFLLQVPSVDAWDNCNLSFWQLPSAESPLTLVHNKPEKQLRTRPCANLYAAEFQQSTDNTFLTAIYPAVIIESGYFQTENELKIIHNSDILQMECRLVIMRRPHSRIDLA